MKIDTILKILINVLKEYNNEYTIITDDVLPLIINSFKISKNNKKIREKCLIIISLLLNKLSYADGNYMELFNSILVSNPKMLLDKKIDH